MVSAEIFWRSIYVFSTAKISTQSDTGKKEQLVHMNFQFRFYFYVGTTFPTSWVQVVYIHFHTTPPFSLGDQIHKKNDGRKYKKRKNGDCQALSMKFWFTQKLPSRVPGNDLQAILHYATLSKSKILEFFNMNSSSLELLSVILMDLWWSWKFIIAYLPPRRSLWSITCQIPRELSTLNNYKAKRRQIYLNIMFPPLV